MRCFTTPAPLLLSSTLALGQFGPGVQITSQFAMPTEIMSADLDGDLELDVVMRNDGAIVWSRNLGQGTFGALDTIYASTWPQFSWFSAFDLADVDMDGAVDLVVLNRQDSLLVWLPNVNGTGSFGPAQLIADLHGQFDLGAIRCTNIMGDAFPEAIMNVDYFGKMKIYINESGEFTNVDSLISSWSGPMNPIIPVGDVDLNGANDVVIQHWSGTVRVLLNSGGAGNTWTDTLLIGYSGGANFYGSGQLQLIDVEGDGDLDVADAANDNTPVWAEGFAVDSGGYHLFHAGYIGPETMPYGHTGWTTYLGCGSTASALWSSGPDHDTLNWSLFDAQLDAFGPSLSWASETGIQLIRTADLNGDGSQDLILAHADTIVTWYPNLLPAVPASSIELTPFDTLCAYGLPYALNHASPQGGMWYGEGVTGNVFTPPGSGTFSLTYHVVDAVSGCPMSAVQSIAAVTTPVITLVSGKPDECALDPLQFVASPAGGLWSGIAASDGSVDRSCAARPNAGEVLYVLNAVNGGECFANGDNMSLPGCLLMNLGPDVTLCTNGDTLHVSAQGPSMGGADITGCDEVLFTPPSSVHGLFYPDHAPGDYVIAAMVFGANLCPGYDTLMVTVVEPPTVELIAPVAVDIDGGSVTFDGGTPPGGSYMIGDDETSTVDPITYNVGDSIVVVYSYTEPLTGCTGSDTAYVLVEQITSIDAAPGGTVVHVAPNPAHGHCIVRLAIDDVGRFTLLDALGRTARAWAPRRTPALLDLSGLPGGSYLLRVETPEGSTHHRLALE